MYMLPECCRSLLKKAVEDWKPEQVCAAWAVNAKGKSVKVHSKQAVKWSAEGRLRWASWQPGIGPLGVSTVLIDLQCVVAPKMIAFDDVAYWNNKLLKEGRASEIIETMRELADRKVREI